MFLFSFSFSFNWLQFFIYWCVCDCSFVICLSVYLSVLKIRGMCDCSFVNIFYLRYEFILESSFLPPSLFCSLTICLSVYLSVYLSAWRLEGRCVIVLLLSFSAEDTDIILISSPHLSIFLSPSNLLCICISVSLSIIFLSIRLKIRGTSRDCSFVINFCRWYGYHFYFFPYLSFCLCLSF